MKQALTGQCWISFKMTNLVENKFKSRAALFDQLSFDVVERLGAGISGRQAASMLLSGGTTPGPLYEKMSCVELDWQKVYFAPTDERWVAPDHADSNEKLIRDSLLKNNAAVANYVGLKSDGETPLIGQAETERKLAALPRPFDVVLLGMGEDGHFASLFPGLADTKEAMSADQ